MIHTFRPTRFPIQRLTPTGTALLVGAYLLYGSLVYAALAWHGTKEAQASYLAPKPAGQLTGITRQVPESRAL